ncbi:L-seryl-tRNA(Sec) selenium transferase [Planctomycetota bacterium]|nr:L-seryl-tRNA(Sec) selenium transferase [Planctomycetota bacterium]
MPETTSATFRDLPKVDILLESDTFDPLINDFGRALVADEIRRTIDQYRDTLKTGKPVAADFLKHETLASTIRESLQRLLQPKQCRVINATGVILHTSLGRAPIAPEVAEKAIAEAAQYSCLELNRESGKRGDRDLLVNDIICRITGAEAATVLNNNAAATMIILNELAEDKEVICSRQHMVEIGGSFRMPDVMRKARCKLVEIGCTNKTKAEDYEDAITENTGMLLKVHTSNYAIIGFTHETSLEEIAEIGQRRDIPAVYDLGAGSLVDLEQYGIEGEPSVQKLLDDGADLVCFSGDKLFGGPQAGIIVGRKDLVDRIKKNPYYRMMRCDKVTLSLLEHTLKMYLNPETVIENIPTLRAIARPEAGVLAEAEDIAERLNAGGVTARIEENTSQIGGGSTPGERLPTHVVVIDSLGGSLVAAAKRLRMGTPSIFCRIEDDALKFDPRTLLPGQEHELTEAILNARA